MSRLIPEAVRTIVCFAGVAVVLSVPLGLFTFGVFFSLWYLFVQFCVLLVAVVILRVCLGRWCADWVIDALALLASAAGAIAITYFRARIDGMDEALRAAEMSGLVTVPAAVCALVAVTLWRTCTAKG